MCIEVPPPFQWRAHVRQDQPLEVSLQHALSIQKYRGNHEPLLPDLPRVPRHGPGLHATYVGVMCTCGHVAEMESFHVNGTYEKHVGQVCSSHERVIDDEHVAYFQRLHACKRRA